MATTSRTPDARGTLRPGTGHVPMPRDAIEGTIASAIERQIAARPDAEAVRMGDHVLTYGGLGRAADRVAADLVAAGLSQHPRTDGLPPVVAVAARQSIELIVAIVGVLKAGAAYIPLDPAHPPERSAGLLSQVDAALIVADQASADIARRLAGPSRPVVVAQARAPEPESDGAPVRRTDDPSAAAYIYSTSGSTGRSKAVVDSHRNVLHNVWRYTNSLAIGPGDRLSLVQSSTFSGAVSSMFGALVNGAACIPFDVRRDGAAALGRWARDEKLTIFHAVPVLFRALCADGERFPDIRVVRLEGDAASWSDVELFRARFDRGAVLVNGLGATETGLVRQFFVDHDTPLGTGGLPLGYPVPDMDVRLVDEDGDPVPPGDPGEIEVRSRFLALGYHGDAERTARSFRPDDGLGRGYRTGDLGRLDPDGRLTGLGRRDFAEKVGGETVDLAEVEMRLRAQPGVREAVALTRRNGHAGSVRLIAYVVPEGDPPAPDRLRRALAESLPRSSVPSSIVTLDALPLDASAKVDRARLPPPSDARPALAQPYSEPSSPLEVELAGIWEELLGVRPIGVQDDFFDLGGDSLDAARLTAALGERLGVDAADDAVGRASTIAELARALAGERPAGDGPVWFAVPGDRFDTAFYARPRRAFDGRAFLRPLAPTAKPDATLSIATDAAGVVEQMRSVQPTGPYHVAGFCFGAVTALEVAHRLHDDGDEVAGVALLGITPLEFPNLIDWSGAWNRSFRFRRWARRNIANALAAGGPRDVVRHLGRHIEWLGWRTWQATRRMLAARGVGSWPQPENPFGRRLAAIAAFPARPFDGHVTIVLGAESARVYTGHPDRTWRRLAREVDVVLLPGQDHDMLVDPGAAGLAAALTRIAVPRDRPRRTS